jgi:predicted metal-binding protein
MSTALYIEVNIPVVKQYKKRRGGVPFEYVSDNLFSEPRTLLRIMECRNTGDRLRKTPYSYYRRMTMKEIRDVIKAYKYDGYVIHENQIGVQSCEPWTDQDFIRNKIDPVRSRGI